MPAPSKNVSIGTVPNVTSVVHNVSIGTVCLKASLRRPTDTSTKIKCCGMSREADIAAVNAARPDFCGFVIDFPRSHRSVTPKRARELSALLAPGIAPVGVFVDEPVETVAALVADGALSAVQLHGHETEGYIASLRAALAAAGCDGSAAPAPLVIQAFRVQGPDDISAANTSSADIVLLDNGQGTGETFDWDFAAGIERPYILAGGLSPGNLGEAVRRLCPWGVDLSSGLETDGLKDPDKIRAAVDAVRKEDR